jgi:hypothetical protein
MPKNKDNRSNLDSEDWAGIMLLLEEAALAECHSSDMTFKSELAKKLLAKIEKRREEEAK